MSLWFVLEGDRHQPLSPDTGEFHKIRWWTLEEVFAEDPAVFDPHLGRMLDKLVESMPPAVTAQ